MLPFLVVNLILGCAALVLLLPLRSKGGRPEPLVLGLCFGVLTGVLAVKGAVGYLGYDRDSNIRPVIKYALQSAEDSRPQLLLVGSSFTALGVDDALLERDLAKRGLHVQVLDLAKSGNLMISQDYTIDAYLSNAKKVPEYILIELGPEYYNDPGGMGDSYIDTGTAIADHTIAQMPWRVRSIESYDAPRSERASKLWNLGTHVLFNLTNFGLSGQLLADKDVSGAPGFTPEDVAHKQVKKDEIADLAQSVHAPMGPQASQLAFILEFRRMQIQKLRSRGAKVVGFYQTALTPVGLREYGASVCARLRYVPCFTAEDPKLRAELDDPKLWFDPVHLLHPGAEIYSSWFADRLAQPIAAAQRAGGK